MRNPSNLEFQKKFDTIADDYEKVSNTYTIMRRSESFQINSSGLILEVGSATGVVTESLKNVVLTDISFTMCKRANLKSATVVCCDAEMLPFKENLFDRIISSEMIYYLQNPENFLFYSHKILKKGGMLLISMANPKMKLADKIRSMLRRMGARRAYFDDGVKEFMELDRLVSLLEKYNFRINSIEKKVLFPFEIFDKINRLLEKTFLSYLGIFIIVKATAK